MYILQTLKFTHQAGAHPIHRIPSERLKVMEKQQNNAANKQYIIYTYRCLRII